MAAIHNLPIAIGLAIVLCSCVTFQPVSWQEQVPARYPAFEGRTALLSAIDKDDMDFRKRKEEEFVMLADHTIDHLKLLLERKSLESDAVHNRRVDLTRQDSTLALALPDKNYKKAVIISSMSVYFDETGWTIVEDEDGKKTKVREFDIVSEIGYRLVSPPGSRFDTSIVARKYFGERSGISGSIGPSVTKNTKEAIAIVEYNAELYLRSYYPWMRNRTRYVYSGSGSDAITAAIKKNDLKQALILSRRQLSGPKPLTISMVQYNCAVLCEALGEKSDMMDHLRKAVESKPVAPSAGAMFEEYSNK